MAVEGTSGGRGLRPAGASSSWASLMHTVGVQVPLEVRRSITARRRLARLRVGKV